MIVHVTNHCNFRCQHCFIDFSPKNDQSLEFYQKLGRDAGKLFWLDIAGGEPFLRKDIVDIVDSFDAKVIQIPTNGSLEAITIKRVEELIDRSSAEVSVSLSLDGPKDIHDKVRGKKGSYDQVWETFSKLKKIKDLKVKINTVLTAENHDSILPFMEEVRKYQPDFHSIILLRGEPANPELGLPPMEKLLELGPKIFNILETYDYGQSRLTTHILRNYHKYLWNISLKTIRKRTQVIPCLAGKAHMVVMGNGDVSSCEMLPPVGNLKDHSWSEIMKSKALQDQKSYIKNKKCFCTHNCAMLDSILFRPQSIPHLLHEKIRTQP